MAQIVMIVDGDTKQAAGVQNHLRSKMGLETVHVETADEALRHLVSAHHAQPDVILFAVERTSAGLSVIRSMRSFRNDVQVITMHSHSAIERGEQSLAHGASDFLLMPFHPMQLTAAIRGALLRRDLQIEARHAWSGLRLSLDMLEPQSTALRAAFFMARKLAEGDSAIVLEGPPGSGREMLARAMHGSSTRRKHPFMTLNASVLLPAEMDECLFGAGEEPGLFEQVGAGTLFVRNVDSFSDAVRQQILLIAQGQLGVSRNNPDKRFAGRLVFAMSDAPRRSGSGEKHELAEFFAALNALPLSLPHLRDITEDITCIAMLYCRRYAALEGKIIHDISPEARQMLREISWPGNIEQLSQGVFNAVMCCQGNVLQVEDFRFLFRPQAATVSYLRQQEPRSLHAASSSGNRIDGVLQCVDASGNVKRLEDMEQEMIRYALERYSGHMSEVARHLGIGRSTLYRKISGMDGK